MNTDRPPNDAAVPLSSLLRSAAGDAWRARSDLFLYHLLFSALSSQLGPSAAATLIEQPDPD